MTESATVIVVEPQHALTKIPLISKVLLFASSSVTCPLQYATVTSTWDEAVYLYPNVNTERTWRKEEVTLRREKPKRAFARGLRSRHLRRHADPFAASTNEGGSPNEDSSIGDEANSSSSSGSPIVPGLRAAHSDDEGDFSHVSARHPNCTNEQRRAVLLLLKRACSCANLIRVVDLMYRVKVVSIYSSFEPSSSSDHTTPNSNALQHNEHLSTQPLTPLTLAASCGLTETCKLLVEKFSTNPMQQASSSNTSKALHFACQSGVLPCVEFLYQETKKGYEELYKNKALTQSSFYEGNFINGHVPLGTALTRAVASKALSVVDFLLKKKSDGGCGASPIWPNSDRWSPMDVAVLFEDPVDFGVSLEMVKLLHKAGAPLCHTEIEDAVKKHNNSGRRRRNSKKRSQTEDDNQDQQQATKKRKLVTKKKNIVKNNISDDADEDIVLLDDDNTNEANKETTNDDHQRHQAILDELNAEDDDEKHESRETSGFEEEEVEEEVDDEEEESEESADKKNSNYVPKYHRPNGNDDDSDEDSRKKQDHHNPDYDDDGSNSSTNTNDDQLIQMHLSPEESMSPLLLAAEVGNVKLLDWLLQNGADPTARNGMGQTCLHICNLRKHDDCVKYLVRSGCVDINAKDLSGDDAFSAARKRQHLEMVNHFKDYAFGIMQQHMLQEQQQQQVRNMMNQQLQNTDGTISNQGFRIRPEDLPSSASAGQVADHENDDDDDDDDDDEELYVVTHGDGTTTNVESNSGVVSNNSNNNNAVQGAKSSSRGRGRGYFLYSQGDDDSDEDHDLPPAVRANSGGGVDEDDL